MLVAIVALIFAASSTAVAASGMVGGDRLIKQHSLSGNRLRNFTITRRQINFSKLGTVPSAANAAHATRAATATTAANANNANTLDGLQPSSFDPAADTIRTGLVRVNQDTTVTLATFQPFTLTATCTNNAGTWDARIDVSSSVAGSIVDGKTITGSSTVVDTGPVSGQTETKKTGVEFLTPNPVDRVAYFGDLVTIAESGGMYSDSCDAAALITAS